MTEPVVIKSVADPSADREKRIPWVYADGMVEDHIDKVMRANKWLSEYEGDRYYEPTDLVCVEATLDELGSHNGIFTATCYGMDVYLILSTCRYTRTRQYPDGHVYGIINSPSELTKGLNYLRNQHCHDVNLDTPRGGWLEGTASPIQTMTKQQDQPPQPWLRVYVHAHGLTGSFPLPEGLHDGQTLAYVENAMKAFEVARRHGLIKSGAWASEWTNS